MNEIGILEYEMIMLEMNFLGIKIRWKIKKRVIKSIPFIKNH